MCKDKEVCVCRVPCERCISVTVANSCGKIIYTAIKPKVVRERLK
jgi:hypothetical protein